MNTDVFKLRSSNVGLGTVDLENPVDALLPARVPHVGEKDTAVSRTKMTWKRPVDTMQIKVQMGR